MKFLRRLLSWFRLRPPVRNIARECKAAVLAETWALPLIDKLLRLYEIHNDLVELPWEKISREDYNELLAIRSACVVILRQTSVNLPVDEELIRRLLSQDEVAERARELNWLD